MSLMRGLPILGSSPGNHNRGKASAIAKSNSSSIMMRWTHTIYLFLRTASRRPYTYLGRLKYLAHDTEREYPVYFQWQLLDWPPPPDVVQRMHLDVQVVSLETPRELEPVATNQETSRLVIEEYLPPHIQQSHGTTTRTFRIQKAADYAEIDAKNRALGRAGECLVLQYEGETLSHKGRPDLAQQVRHVAQIEGDGAGYDILSFSEDGTVKYIEVKMTRGSAETAFFLSANELAFARQHHAHYYVYRLYGYHRETHSGRCYIIEGNPESRCEVTPTEYRLRPR
jgi:hypothetical protein